ncbi:anti-sigma F factor antagonist [Bacillus andreraoultii]|uniref:anti-sigma F factor antagonist n=1 Tax=Bacillus andreraoultii TaxID=1499685 RepID=UPI000539FEBC|nr:anti-sigma F factor antagonist [Bacillus andreraoultii]
MSLQVNLEWKEKHILVVRLSGELDHHTADTVRDQVSQAMEEGEVKYLIVNLESLTFMDSSGLGVILGRYKQIKQINGEMIVCSVPPSIERLFNMSGLFKIVHIDPTEEQALLRLGVA